MWETDEVTSAMKRTVLTVVALGCAACLAQAQPSTEMDYTKLNLRIAKAYSTPRIDGANMRLTPKAGSQLVVVELEGSTTGPMEIVLAVADFTADTGTRKSPAEGIGVEIRGNQWVWTNYQQKWSQGKAGPVSFRIAFGLDPRTKAFTLRCGDAVLKATLNAP